MSEANQMNDNPIQPQSGEIETTQSNPSSDAAINAGINRTVDAIVDLAMTKISDEQERELVQSNVAGVLRDTLHEMVDSKIEPQVRTQIQAMAIGDAAEAGIDVAKQVQNLGFVEFTAGLINGTFDAITGATIKQMQAYADLVANLAKTLKQFEAENISQAQVTAHLIERYPQPEDNSKTVVDSDYDFKDITGGKTANQQLTEVANALVAETGNLDLEERLSIDLKTDIEDGTTKGKKFTSKAVEKIRGKLSESLAQSMLDHLREMAREGMARIVITDGEILSKLTFKVTSTEADRKAKSRYVREQGSAYIRARAGWGWGRASIGGNYSKLDVQAVNESSFDSLTMSTEIIGQVKLRFRTETFPPVEGN